MIETTLGEHARFWRGNEARARRALAAREAALHRAGCSPEDIARDPEFLECGLDVEFARLKAVEIDRALADIQTLREALRAHEAGMPGLPPINPARELRKGDS